MIRTIPIYDLLSLFGVVLLSFFELNALMDESLLFDEDLATLVCELRIFPSELQIFLSELQIFLFNGVSKIGALRDEVLTVTPSVSVPISLL